MERKVILCFNDIFPDEERQKSSTYLKNINKNEIFQLAANFGRLNNFENPDKEVLHALNAFFGKENHELANDIYNKSKKLNPPSFFYNPITSLILIEQAYILDYDGKTENYHQAEIALFKAYLSINSDYTNRQEKAFDSIKDLDAELQLPMMTFCSMYADNDKSNYSLSKQIICQTIKSSYLFDYLCEVPKVVPILNEFYKLFSVDKWETYIQRLLPLVKMITDHDQGHLKIKLDPKNEDYKLHKMFLEVLSLKFEDQELEMDFLVLRNTPIVKLEEDLYLIVFDLFVVEKLYKGIHFIFRDLNKKLPKKEQVDIRGLFTLGFSEQTLLYKAMDEIYPDAKVKITGKELDDKKIDGAPDYYLRENNNILLMESKDILIDKDIKYSYDFSQYESVFEEKLFQVYDPKKDKWKSKAILQLINSIKNILNKKHTFDEDYNTNRIVIYPVIVLHDFQYNVPGLEYWMNSWFQEEVEELKNRNYKVKNIRPLSIINIDSLLLHSENMLSSVNLIDLLEIRHRRKNPMLKKKFKSRKDFDDYQFELIEPFSLFIDKYFHGRGIKKNPKLSKKISKTLFE